jgi:hypothetical protein
MLVQSVIWASSLEERWKEGEGERERERERERESERERERKGRMRIRQGSQKMRKKMDTK